MKDRHMQDGRFVLGLIWGTLISLPIWVILLFIGYLLFL
ncbi:hypothetical protein DB29_03173 [Shouchella clausii]|nr:hypothetical protein DB29_03173 [Shouchella clausii]